MKGCYLLLIHLEKDTTLMTRSKSFELSKGHYIYVGSGMKDLLARVSRHLKSDKKLFWHVDYLLTVATVESVLLIPAHEECERKIAEMLEKTLESVHGFGASDSPLVSHLFKLPRREEFGHIVGMLLKSL
ncbi:MAG: DUF123 domain-containing protein [Thermotogae bacterium]|nr:DUF123 domain-containing protein [Thermotogota bacterium]